ncbi:MAG: hypothetical protein JW908_03100 [Anaerolineales bacterium]|nr:hypothetical protein [Anaerolineales bacterium]
MTKTQVFVIRLFINSSFPNSLRGSVESIGRGETRIFTDGQNLIDVLRCMSFSSDYGFSDELPGADRENQQDKNQ